MTHQHKSALFSLALISTMTLSTPAFAEETDYGSWTLTPQTTTTHRLVTPSEPTALSRIAPTADNIIKIGDPKMTPNATLADTGSVFDSYRSKAALSRMDIDAIKAEIETRFRMHTALPQAQTGISFDPDLSMLFKPFAPAGYQDPLTGLQR